MIKRIRIDGYKSFKSLDIELKPLTVIFGPNASGKSNFLDAIYLLSQAVTKKNLNEAFKGHRGLPMESFYCGEGGYEGLVANSNPGLSFEVDVEISPRVIKAVEKLIREKRKGVDSTDLSKQIVTEKLLRYRLKIEILSETGHLRIMDERLCAIKSNGEEKKRRAFLEKNEETNRLHLRMEGQSHPTYHEIGLDHTIVSTALYEPHYPHITAFRTELANWYTYYLEPRELMRGEFPLAEIESLGPRGENLAPFLNTLKHKYKKDYENFNSALKMILPSAPNLDIVQDAGRVGLRLKENNNWFSARLISEGTLRLIGLLCSVHPRNPAEMVAFEEPENGVHPVRLKIISDLLKNASQQYGKQIIVTTHSSILPGYFEVENLFLFKKERNQTTIDPNPSYMKGPLFKKQYIDGGLSDMIVRGDFGG
jgi:predicted ATPase